MRNLDCLEDLTEHLGIDIPQSIKQRKFVEVPASQGGPGSGPTPITRELVKRPLRAIKKVVTGN